MVIPFVPISPTFAFFSRRFFNILDEVVFPFVPVIPIIFIFCAGCEKNAAESLASATLVSATFITQTSSLFISLSTTIAFAPCFTISSITS